jgi:choline dehydrogenase-like flavoprotein
MTENYDRVVVSRDGSREVYRGDIVAVSAGAANSAKLLLNSATDKHPNGWRTAQTRWDATTCSTHHLYVVDTSFFPSIGAVNPALTAIANALRVGDHLRQRMA